jgi:HAD superfamily hydrolase (TIGR01490 family)
MQTESVDAKPYPEAVPVTPRAAAFFDLDKTIIARSSALAFSTEFARAGLINRRAMLRSALAQLVFTSAGADHDQMERLRVAMTELVTGWDVAQVSAIVEETLHELIEPMIYAEAAHLIAAHQSEGRDVIIVSSSGQEVVDPIARLLGADDAIATRMVIEDGRYTGNIEFYAYGPTKAEAIQGLADTKGYDLDASYAYSDSITDLPMLNAVGHPFAVNPDKELRRIATERGWGVLDFATPVALRRMPSGEDVRHRVTDSAHSLHERMQDIPRSQRVAAGVGVGVAAAGLVWYASRHRRI